MSRNNGLVLFDFDGTIAEYYGWKVNGKQPGPPLPGAREAIAGLRAQGFRVEIWSARAMDPKGREQILKYLFEHGIDTDGISDIYKPKEVVLIVDDRAVRADGTTLTAEKLQDMMEPFWKATAPVTMKDVYNWLDRQQMGNKADCVGCGAGLAGPCHRGCISVRVATAVNEGLET